VEPSTIVKRDGAVVPFDRVKVVQAILRALDAVGRADEMLAEELGQVVVEHLVRTADTVSPGIEEVQDAVIYVLQESGEYDVALAYTRYRDSRERQRRQRRIVGTETSQINLMVLGRDGRRRAWSRDLIETHLQTQLELTNKAALDVCLAVEGFLADSVVTEISTVVLLSLIDAALVRCGFTEAAEKLAPLRLDRRHMRQSLSTASCGRDAVREVGRHAFTQLSLVDGFPSEVLRLYCKGRLWVDGLDDPLRGSEFTAALDGSSNPWQTLATAFTLATDAGRHWRGVNLIIPPMILGHLERGAMALVEPMEQLAQIANCYLYCDGRTPLLDEWPFRSKQISIATYAEDFLLLRRLQELGLGHMSGPHLMQGGYRRRVAVKLAINAQGLDEQYSQMDALAMALVSAARIRQRSLVDNPALAGADIRYAIFGLPPGAPSNEYLERQVVQEGLRCGIALSRSTNLPEDACAHLGRLFE
jgi:transcriptional regulator NrdR family protein